MKQGFVYIMANLQRPTLYVGVTSNLVKRVYEHKNNLDPHSFTCRYHIHTLLYYETLETIEQAIIREKQIKDINRKEKLEMIEKFNPNMKDLYEEILDTLRRYSGQAPE